MACISNARTCPLVRALSMAWTARTSREGAEDGIRTRDLRFTKPLLYQLSYFGLTAERREHATHWPSRKPQTRRASVDRFIPVVMDQHSSAIDQATLARFLTEGFFLSHVKRMRKLYSERRDFFIEQFNKTLGDHFVLQIPEAGLQVVAWMRRQEDFPLFVRARTETGITPSTLSFYSIEADLDPAFIFGFAAWSRAQIREALAKLASAFQRLKQDDAS